VLYSFKKIGSARSCASTTVTYWWNVGPELQPAVGFVDPDDHRQISLNHCAYTKCLYQMIENQDYYASNPMLKISLASPLAERRGCHCPWCVPRPAPRGGRRRAVVRTVQTVAEGSVGSGMAADFGDNTYSTLV
jgi:hypothetical protein